MQNKQKFKAKFGRKGKMTYFSNIIKAISKYEDEIRTADEKYHTERENAIKLFRAPEEKLRSIAEVYAEEKEGIKSRCLDTITVAFEGIRRELSEIITEAVPADFILTLEALKSNGPGLSEYEAEAYINKYKRNYLAMRTLIGMLQQNGKCANTGIINAESVSNRLRGVEREITKAIQNEKIRSMGFTIYMSESGPVQEIFNDTESFIKKEFLYTFENGKKVAIM